MRKYIFILITVPVILLLTGCGAKPEDVVKSYINRMCAYDIAGAKKLCTGAARDELGNMQETMEVQRVMAAGADIPPTREDFIQVDANIKFNVEQMTKTSVDVIVTTEEEQVIFHLAKINGKWLISSISNPFIGLPKKGKV